MSQAYVNKLIKHGNVFEVASFIRDEYDGLTDEVLEELLARLWSLLLPEKRVEVSFHLVQDSTANIKNVVDSNSGKCLGRIIQRLDGLWHPSTRPYQYGDGWYKPEDAAKELLGVPDEQIREEQEI